jgi:hypothetical protein
LLAAACAAVLCGQVSYAAIAQWTRNQSPEFFRALGFFRRPPTDGAFRYLFHLLDPALPSSPLSALGDDPCRGDMHQKPGWLSRNALCCIALPRLMTAWLVQYSFRHTVDCCATSTTTSAISRTGWGGSRS